MRSLTYHSEVRDSWSSSSETLSFPIPSKEVIPDETCKSRSVREMQKPGTATRMHQHHDVVSKKEKNEKSFTIENRKSSKRDRSDRIGGEIFVSLFLLSDSSMANIAGKTSGYG